VTGTSIDGSTYLNTREDDIINDVDPTGQINEVLRVKRSTVLSYIKCPITMKFHKDILARLRHVNNDTSQLAQNLSSISTQIETLTNGLQQSSLETHRSLMNIDGTLNKILNAIPAITPTPPTPPNDLGIQKIIMILDYIQRMMNGRSESLFQNLKHIDTKLQKQLIHVYHVDESTRVSNNNIAQLKDMFTNCLVHPPRHPPNTMAVNVRPL